MADKPVAIVMGSQSDWATMKHAAETLDALDIAHDDRIVSAHRTPDRLVEFAKGAKAAGFKVIIAGAGGAAHLPGMIAVDDHAAGVRRAGADQGARAARTACFDRPDAAGVPVGTLAIGDAGATNAALLAASVLALARSRPRRPARSLAQAADRCGRRNPHRRGRRVSAPFVRVRAGRTIGILGGGQLGRMLALAASRLGFKTHIYAPSRRPAFDVVRRVTVAAYDDKAALDRFAGVVDVVTYEFENVPAGTAAFLAARKPLRPGPQVLAISQDRLAEKHFIAALGIADRAYAGVAAAGELGAGTRALLGLPAVLKTTRLGYDGKGQATLRAGDDRPRRGARSAASRPSSRPSSRSSAKSRSSSRAATTARIACFDVPRTSTATTSCTVSRAPADMSPAVAAEARRIAARIAEALDYVGVLGVEMFVVRDGAGHAVLVNEIAPRVHNSGHWTDGCAVSQFEQHIRAIAGWPLGDPVRYGRVVMINLIGDEVRGYRQWLETPGACVHLYGKRRSAPGRKMGHVTRVFPRG